MNKKALIASLLTLFVFASFVGWFLLREQKTTEESPKPPVIGENQSQMTDQYHLQNIQAIPGNSDEVWYVIPEMGVRMRLNKRYAEDLYYGLKEWRGEADGNSLDFYLTNQVAKGAPSCSDWISLGGLFRYEGNLGELKRRRDELDPYLATRLDSYIQVGSYYYGWLDPHDVCWDVSMEEKVKEAFLEKYGGFGANNTREGIKTLELIP